MYKPNFILVGGVATETQKSVKDYVAEKQMAGDYSAIADILMDQFTSLSDKPKGGTHGKNYQQSERAF